MYLCLGIWDWGGWEKVQVSVGGGWGCGRGGMGGGRGGGVCCQWEVPEGCSCHVNNILQCTLEGVQIVGDKRIRRKSVPLGYFNGKKLYL